jgi:hypothetical protein
MQLLRPIFGIDITYIASKGGASLSITRSLGFVLVANAVFVFFLWSVLEDLNLVDQKLLRGLVIPAYILSVMATALYFIWDEWSTSPSRPFISAIFRKRSIMELVVPPFRVGLGDMLHSLQTIMRRPPPIPFSWRARVISLVYFCIAAVAAVITAGALVLIVARFAGAVIIFLCAAWLLWFTMRGGMRALSPAANEVLAHDTRAPVLFLRTFSDDIARIREDTHKSREWTAWDFILKKRITLRRRLEEIVTPPLRFVGPCIAIGAPGEVLPQLGAARAYFTNEEWQSAVLNLMDKARLIIIVPGPGRWVEWEIRNVIAKNYFDKLIFAFPPSLDPVDFEKRWANVPLMFHGTRWREPMEHLVLEGLLTVHFRANGQVCPIHAIDPSVKEYEMALLIAMYDLLCKDYKAAA